MQSGDARVPYLLWVQRPFHCLATGDSTCLLWRSSLPGITVARIRNKDDLEEKQLCGTEQKPQNHSSNYTKILWQYLFLFSVTLAICLEQHWQMVGFSITRYCHNRALMPNDRGFHGVATDLVQRDKGLDIHTHALALLFQHGVHAFVDVPQDTVLATAAAKQLA